MEVFNEDLTQWSHKLHTKDKEFLKKGWRCDIFQRKQQGFKTDMIRIDCIMKDINPEKFTDYFVNPPKKSMIKESRIIETRPNGDLVMYMRFKIPFMTERDNVMVVHEEPV